MVRYLCDICGKQIDGCPIECRLLVADSRHNFPDGSIISPSGIDVQFCRDCAKKLAGGDVYERWATLHDPCGGR